MSAYSTNYYTTGALPIPASKGSGQYPSYQYQNTSGGYYPSGGESTYSVSPPEDLLEASVSSESGYGNSYSVATSSYAGSCSAADYDGTSTGSVGGVDLNEYMQERFAATFDPIALDKCTVKQAQT
jgi:hypothetical protein